MSFEDWLTHFDVCQVFNLSPESLWNIESEVKELSAVPFKNVFSMWHTQIVHGQWVKGRSAGGCGRNNLGLCQDKSFYNDQNNSQIPVNLRYKCDREILAKPSIRH